MRVEALLPDAPQPAPARTEATGFAGLVDAAGAVLARAGDAEAAFAEHRGGMLEMVVERARADVALQIAASAAQRSVQSLQTLLGMQL